MYLNNKPLAEHRHNQDRRAVARTYAGAERRKRDAAIESLLADFRPLLDGSK